MLKHSIKRRRILKGIAAGALVPILGACGDETPGNASHRDYATVFESIPPLSGTASTTKVMHQLLEELRQAYETIGEHVSSTLATPIAPTELVERCQWFPGTLPAELLALYSWRGGQEPEKDNTSSPFVFRDVEFSTPERARDEYSSMMSSYGSMPPIDARVELKYCFPFAAFSGGWYVFPCSRLVRLYARKSVRDRRDRAVIFSCRL